MKLQVTPEGWVDMRNEIVWIGHGDDEVTRDVHKEQIKEGVERVMQSKGQTPPNLPNL